MPVRSAAVATFDKAVGSRARGSFLRLVGSVVKRIAAFAAAAESAAFGLVQLDRMLRRISRASNLLKTSRIVSSERASLPAAFFITSFTSRNSVDRFPQASHRSEELFCNQRIAELSICWKRTLQPPDSVMKGVEYRKDTSVRPL
eukprot:951753-Pleurochrysis_carterae.AAC.2